MSYFPALAPDSSQFRATITPIGSDVTHIDGGFQPMPTIQKQFDCPDCQRKTLHVKTIETPDCGVIFGMAVISAVTCGLALPVILE